MLFQWVLKGLGLEFNIALSNGPTAEKLKIDTATNMSAWEMGIWPVCLAHMNRLQMSPNSLLYVKNWTKNPLWWETGLNIWCSVYSRKPAGNSGDRTQSW